MNQETKVLGIIGAITLLVVIGGAVLLGKNSGEATPAPTVEAQNLVVDYAPIRGNKEAKVTLVEFSDYQCPACKVAVQDVEKIINEYGDKLYFVYRQFPLPIHKNSKVGAYAALAAGKQDKYWEMHLKLFEKQEEWSEMGNPRDTFVGYAKDLGMDVEKFNTDMNGNDIFNTVEKEISEGTRLGINSTPSFFINGQKYSGVLTYAQMKTAIDQLLNENE